MIFKKHGHRHGASKRVKILAWLSIIGWCLMLAALVIFHYARPELDYGILRYFGVDVRSHWMAELKFWYAFLLVVCAVISLCSLYINRTKVKHRPHRIRYNLVLLLLISVTLLIGVL